MVQMHSQMMKCGLFDKSALLNIIRVSQLLVTSPMMWLYFQVNYDFYKLYQGVFKLFYLACINAAVASNIRQLKPHSLSYQAMTFTKLPITVVCLASKFDEVSV